MVNKVYTIENVDCANCAAKIEALINKMPDVEEATITFSTKQLRVTAENPDELIPQMTALANKIENNVIITEKKNTLRHTQGTHKKSIQASSQKHEAVHVHSHGIEHKHVHEECAGGCCCHEHSHNSHDCHDDHDVVETQVVKKDSVLEKFNDKNCILIGLPLFILGVALQQLGYEGFSIGVFLLAYAVLGGEILLTAVKNIGKGQIFDENFLMSIATIGAFCIQEYPEAVGVMLFFRIGEYFEERAVERSRNQIMEAVDLRPEVVNIVTANGQLQTIPSEEAKIGDVILVKPGERIPLDGIVLAGESRIDNSAITGEPVPVKVLAGTQVMSGGINTSSVLKIRVEKKLEDSMVTRILDSVENAAASKPKIDRFITRFAKIYTPFVVALALGTAIIPSVITGDWGHWVYTALTFLVISCPCALVLSVPLAFFSGIGAASKKGILFKGGISIEALKNVKAIVFDKTGTITEGEFKVQNVICTGNLFKYVAAYRGVEGKESNPKVMQGTGGISKQDVEKYLLYLAASCEKHSTHPIGESIVDAAKRFGIELGEPESVKEIAGRGIYAIMPEGRVLCGNKELLKGSGIDTSQYENVSNTTEVLLAIENEFVGALLIADGIKPDSKQAISKIKRMGISTAILTGDGEMSAKSVAKITGVEKVFAKLLPEDKLNILKDIRKEHGPVMFVGDGINDAPVLAGADVGAAMGDGAEAAIEAADVVFMTSNLDAVPEAIQIAKVTGNTAMQNIIFALAIKVLVMILGLAGKASMWMAVFADSGVAMLCVLNSIRILKRK